MTILYVLMCISVIAPIYTYALYPLILRLFPKRNCRINDDYAPTVSVVIIKSEGCQDAQPKEAAVRNWDYPHISEIKIVENQSEARLLIQELKGDVVVVTDTASDIHQDAISQLVKSLSDERVGCVCGMMRKRPGGHGESRDGANWHYENLVKVLESNIGTLSGANTALYAIKRGLIPDNIDSRISLEFFLPTTVTEQGFDVLFVPEAVAYEDEGQTEQDILQKHVRDGASGYRSIARFWRLLFPRKGSFVFWSHRVMKWLVPFNMLIFLFGSAILSVNTLWALILLTLQVAGYAYLAVYYMKYTLKEKELSGIVGKLSNFASYFLVLNAAWLMGFIYSFRK